MMYVVSDYRTVPACRHVVAVLPWHHGRTDFRGDVILRRECGSWVWARWLSCRLEYGSCMSARRGGIAVASWPYRLSWRCEPASWVRFLSVGTSIVLPSWVRFLFLYHQSYVDGNHNSCTQTVYRNQNDHNENLLGDNRSGSCYCIIMIRVIVWM